MRFCLPRGHAIRSKLEAIFTQRRVTASLKAMKRAGFVDIYMSPLMRIVVCRHKKLPGYLFKLYLDAQAERFYTPVENEWMHRRLGADIIRHEIKARGWGDYVKVPRKWLYPLPKVPLPLIAMKRHNVILVEEDMSLLSAEDNEKKWLESNLSTLYLDIIFHITTKYGFWDGTDPRNVCWSADGKLAFVDTQHPNTWPVHYYMLEAVLPVRLRDYWRSLVVTQDEARGPLLATDYGKKIVEDR